MTILYGIKKKVKEKYGWYSVNFIRKISILMGKNVQLYMEKILLTKAWEKSSAEHLQKYLVQGFQNPLINVQSILSRHFFISMLFGNKYQKLMDQELRFSVEKNKQLVSAQKELNVELRLTEKGDQNKSALKKVMEKILDQDGDRYQKKWAQFLKKESGEKISVLEPACGSANDYRFFQSFGLSKYLDYCGFDLNSTNIKNAKKMFPEVCFKIDNILDIDEADSAYDYVMAFDIFEHLDPSSCERAIAEVCRVARKGLIISFFNMSEIETHKIKQVRLYHWNELSVDITKKSFMRYCKKVNVINIDEFMFKQYGFKDTYNKKAYMFIVRK